MAVVRIFSFSYQFDRDNYWTVGRRNMKFGMKIDDKHFCKAGMK